MGENELIAKILSESYSEIGWESQTAEERVRWLEAVSALETYVEQHEGKESVK